MGTWGTKLNQNDLASDLKSDYIDQLKRGKTNQEVYEYLLKKYEEVIKDEEDGPLFYYVLANIQWDYGRLTDEVKRKALINLCNDPVDIRWENPKHIQQWQDTLKHLYEKLMSPQPQEKKVTKYKLFTCPWQDGDVFAYKLNSEIAVSRGYENKYVVFRKIGDNVWWPGHIVPVVEVYNYLWDFIPSINELDSLDLLILNGTVKDFNEIKSLKPEKYMRIIMEKKTHIPFHNLTYLGNKNGFIKVDDELPSYVNWYQSDRYWYFDTYILELYESWNGY